MIRVGSRLSYARKITFFKIRPPVRVMESDVTAGHHSCTPPPPLVSCARGLIPGDARPSARDPTLFTRAHHHHHAIPRAEPGILPPSPPPAAAAIQGAACKVLRPRRGQAKSLRPINGPVLYFFNLRILLGLSASDEERVVGHVTLPDTSPPSASGQLVWQLARLRYNYRSIPVCAWDR